MMRNRNDKEKSESKARGQNPFEMLSRYEYVELVCSYCKKRINEVNMMEVEWITDNRGQSFDRVHFYREKELKILEYALSIHPCLDAERQKEQAKRISEVEMIQKRLDEIYDDKSYEIFKCSGHRVFPNGEKCPGCDDCRAIVEALAEVEEEKFKMGMWVIDTVNGKTFQILTEGVLEVINAAYKQGSRTIMPYE